MRVCDLLRDLEQKSMLRNCYDTAAAQGTKKCFHAEDEFAESASQGNVEVHRKASRVDCRL